MHRAGSESGSNAQLTQRLLLLTAQVQAPLEACLCRHVDPQLPHITQKLLSTVAAALGVVQALLTQGLDRLHRHLRGNPSGKQLRKEVRAASMLPCQQRLGSRLFALGVLRCMNWKFTVEGNGCKEGLEFPCLQGSLPTTASIIPKSCAHCFQY